MDVLIKHNGVAITDHVISYEREHKICSGIGVLSIVIEGTIGRTFEPWDSIEIYENGDFKVKYYVCDASKTSPGGFITLECQDNSKRLVDYFIPDQYNIDYPSYTGYWIDKFLTEAGITHEFTTDSPGNLLSNYTSLGLTSGYDQIMMLLQLSGWYMYFDGNGKAIIGDLEKELSPVDDSLYKTDVLTITKRTDDKMLRNRVVVWGAFDPVYNEFAYADVSKNTRWNYDRNDKRAIVISNSNIPNKSSAYGIANTLLKEFSNATIEKHITVHGARDYNLGYVLYIQTDIFRGKGIITTFGTKMDRAGLVTNIVLDERCPRLFGFFNFGDYVYVGTFGGGIWRKHIKFDPTWYDFSAGLTNLNVTDLHINNGIFGSVTASGEMFYTLTDAGPWLPITTVTGLMSTASGDATAIDTLYSGLMGRAVIIDKFENTIKYGVDNWSGENTGDYFLSLSGYSAMSTGSGEFRSWIVEFDPSVSMETFYSYPINVSGNYNVFVVDLENDGYNDYVSVGEIGSGNSIEHTDLGYNMGSHTSHRPIRVYNPENTVGFSLMSSFEDESQSVKHTVSRSTTDAWSVFNNESIGEREMVYGTSQLVRKTVDVSGGSPSVSTLTSSSVSTGGTTICFEKINSTTIRQYVRVVTINTNDEVHELKYRDWDTSTNTLSSMTTVGSFTIAYDTVKKAASRHLVESQFAKIGGKVYLFALYIGWGVFTTSPSNWTKIYKVQADATTGTLDYSGMIQQFNFRDFNTSPSNWQTEPLSSDRPVGFLFSTNNNPAIAYFLAEESNSGYENWLISSQDGTTFNITSIQTTSSSSDPDFVYATSSTYMNLQQLTKDRYFAYMKYPTNNAAYIYNGLSVSITHLVTVPFQYLEANIYPVFGTYAEYYIAKSGSTFYFVDPGTLDLVNSITAPADYTLIHPYSTGSSISNVYYWKATNTITGFIEILHSTSSAFMSTSIKPYNVATLSGDRGVIAGNFIMNFTEFLYISGNVPPSSNSIRYLVLQRDNLDYTIIQEEAYPIRVDISNGSPILTVLNKNNTFKSNFVYTDEVLVIEKPQTGYVLEDVQDYRYTLLESSLDPSGILAQSLYLTGSGIYSDDVSTLSGFGIIMEIPSGFSYRIETTNYVASGQYIFVITAGDEYVNNFYQRDPESYIFDSYSGLPDNRSTIIRIDDRI